MWTDVVSLGPAPSEEARAQFEDPDYEDRAARECAAYIEAIRRVCGPEPDGARLRVAWRDHEFGRSLEAVCEFDRDNPAAAEFAARCDDSAPTAWNAAGMNAPGSRSPNRPSDSATTLPGTPLALPLPPEFCLTLGYRGAARFVGFYWSPLGDQSIATDGVNSGTAQSWAFLAYKRHRAAAPLLAPIDLGSSEEDAIHMLLIDRERNVASVAPFAQARAFLAAWHPPAPELSPEQQEAFQRELDRLLAEWRERPVDHEAVAREMQEQRGRVGRMMSFLDTCPVPEREEGPTP